MVLIAQIALGIIIAAAEPTGTLTLACDGTTRDKENWKPPAQPISLAIVVDFAGRKMHGLSYPKPIEINDSEEATVYFRDYDRDLQTEVSGSLDRVTGDLHATISWDIGTSSSSWTIYLLKCKPTQ
jgi:hypothetical protein